MAAAYVRHGSAILAFGIGVTLVGVLLNWERLCHRRRYRAYEQRIAALEQQHDSA